MSDREDWRNGLLLLDGLIDEAVEQRDGYRSIAKAQGERVERLTRERDVAVAADTVMAWQERDAARAELDRLRMKEDEKR